MFTSVEDCDECVPQDQLPLAVEEYSLNMVVNGIYEHFICAPIIWQWAIFYCILYFMSQYFFKQYYYPLTVYKHYKFEPETMAKIATDKRMNFQSRSAIAANKFVSFVAALLTVIRSMIYIYNPSSNWNKNYIWNSIFIPAPKPILDLLDSFLGYFVFDTIYLICFNRGIGFIIHHLVVPLGVIGVKSFGYGCHLGLPVCVTADVTTIFLNLLWFAKDRIKYLNMQNNEDKNMKTISFWELIAVIIQLIFGVSFLYLRLGQLSYLCIPWVLNLIYSKHANLGYKCMGLVGNIALLGVGYFWSIHVLKVMYKALKQLTSPSKSHSSPLNTKMNEDDQKSKQN